MKIKVETETFPSLRGTIVGYVHDGSVPMAVVLIEERKVYDEDGANPKWLADDVRLYAFHFSRINVKGLEHD